MNRPALETAALTAALPRLRVQSRAAAVLAGVAVTCTVLVAWALASDTGRITIKWLVDPVFHSTSAAAALTFLVVVALAAILLAALGTRAPAGLHHHARGIQGALLATIVLGHAVVLLLHLHYAEAVGLPLDLHGYHWNRGDNTYNALLHTHVGKAVLAQAAGLVDHLPGRYDAGTALAGRIPDVAVAGLAVALLVGVVAAFALLPVIARRFDGRWSLVWAYGFAALNCLKTIPDGGPLSYRFLPAMIVLCAMLAARDQAALARIARRLAVPALMVLGVAAVGWHTASGEDYGTAAGGLAMELVALLGPVIVAWHPLRATRRRIRTVALTGLFAFGGTMYAIEAWTGAPSLLAPLPAGYRFTVLDAAGESVVAAGRAESAVSPVDLYRRFGEDPLKPRRTFIWLDDGWGARTLTLGVAFLDARPAPPSWPVSGAVRIESLLPTRHPAIGWLSVRADESVTPPYAIDPSSAIATHNFQVHLHVLAARLRANGAREFVLMPLLDERAQRRFRSAAGGPEQEVAAAFP